MSRISFAELKEAPVSIKVMYAAAMILALVGMILLIMNIYEFGNIRLAVPMAFIVAGQVINLFGICRYSKRSH